jgi:hypothetical protein
MIASVLKGVGAFLDAIPGLVWALIVAGLVGFIVLDEIRDAAELRNTVAKYNKEVQAHAQTKLEYSNYREDAQKKVNLALEALRELERVSQLNAERTARETAQREAAMAAELAQLRNREQRVRDDLATFRAAAARDAQSGNTAALAAKADTAVQLYSSCGEEYRSMAAEAEGIRVQAVGLLDFIRRNPMCSAQFGPDAP